MSQKQVPIPQPDEGGDKGSGDLMSRKLPVKPQTADTLSKLDAMLAEESKNKSKLRPITPQCCGRLPCKGRTPFCFQCDLCLDCITGAGCGHDNSNHRFSNAFENEEKDNE